MKHGLLVFLLGLSSLVQAQVHNPVKWSFSSNPISATEFEIVLKATIEKNWHVYSQKLPSADGPVATEVVIKESPDYQLVGNVQEIGKLHNEYDPNFMMELAYYENELTYKQIVKLTNGATKAVGEVYFMVCDDKMCLPPEAIEFEVDLNPSTFKISEEKIQIDGENGSNNEASASLLGESLQGAPSGILTPVKWSFSSEKVSDKEYNLVATASIDPKWHLYSQFLESSDGPVATEFRFNGEEGKFEVIGKPKERGDKHTDFDPNFEMELSYYENEVSFAQRIKFTGEPGIAKGDVYFMVCDDKQCLPPEEIVFEIDTKEAVAYSGDADSGAGSNEDGASSKSLIAIFIAGFLGGMFALLTPCVFPMIPLTVSFFTKQSKTRAKGISNAILYGVSIIMIYTILGYSITAIFGADALHILSTDPWFNLFFFFLLAVFAISFFGAFEITLPSSWVNAVDQQSYKGGLLGIFFMAFTLSLVSFSCTGPIIGTLLVEAAVNGGVAGPITGMFGFSLALALPFGLFAAFPGWMNTLPQSGGWLNSVKVVLGFLELGLAFKFLSNADLVVQAWLLTREVFIGIWIAISAMLTLYLLGAFRLPHDSPMEKLSVGRMLLATFFLGFTLYLVPGLWGAPLKMISGFPPPMFYSESPQGVGKGGTTIVETGDEGHDAPAGAHAATCPHNLNCFHDYEEGLAYAKKVGKPVMLDFTGWACVNCRRMEEEVWSNPEVLSRLKSDVVLISLYVDENIDLPEGEQFVSETTGKKIKTVGNKWANFQIERYQSNSQPYYMIMDHEENSLVESAAYDPDVKKFIDWLERGKKSFNEGTHL